MKKIISFFLILMIFSAQNLFAQEKYEKESRIHQREVPENAKKLIDPIYDKKKLKWYHEIGLNSESIEAKFKRKEIQYSVEFDMTGNIADVEMKVNWEGLNENLKKAITLQLNKDCENHKIIKVQKQHTGTEANLAKLLNSGKESPENTIKYELIVRCSQPKSVNLFEYLFDEQGQIVSTSKIIFKNSSHLEY